MVEGVTPGIRDCTRAAMAGALMWPLARITSDTMAWRCGVIRSPLRLRTFRASAVSTSPLFSISDGHGITCNSLQQHEPAFDRTAAEAPWAHAGGGDGGLGPDRADGPSSVLRTVAGGAGLRPAGGRGG